jgi:hypothetical protein
MNFSKRGGIGDASQLYQVLNEKKELGVAIKSLFFKRGRLIQLLVDSCDSSILNVLVAQSLVQEIDMLTRQRNTKLIYLMGV